MLVLARLGGRLALTGGRIRAVSVLVGNAIGTVLILATFAVPNAISAGGQMLHDDQKTLVVVIAVFLMVPVVVLLMAVGRLSAGMRDRRLAALRLIGVSGRGIRTVAAAENGILAGIGGGLGIAGFLAAAPWIDHRIAAGPAWFTAPLDPGVRGAVWSWLIVASTSVAVALAPTRHLNRNPLGVRRTGRPQRPTLIRLLPLVLGSCYLLWVVTHPYDAAHSPTPRTIDQMLAAAGVTAVGVPLAIPLLVRLTADGLVRFGRSPSTLLAGRRMQVEPASATRLITGITVAILLVTGATSLVVQIETTPQYINAQLALTTGPQWADAFYMSSPALTELARTPAVQGWAPQRTVGSACDRLRGVKYGEPTAPCLTGVVATCAQMQIVLHVSTTDCVDGKVLHIRGGTHNTRHTTDAPIAFYSPNLGLPTEEDPHVTVTPVGAVTISERPGRYPMSGDILIPPTTPAIGRITGRTDHWVVQLDAGYAARAAALTRAHQLAPHGDFLNEDIADFQAAKGYRVIVWTLAGIVLTIGFAALVIGAVDRIRDRRSWMTAQLALGIPLRTLRSAQLLQTLLPLAVGLTGAVTVGTLAGNALIALGSTDGSTPRPDVTRIAMLCVMAVIATSLATIPALGRRLNPRYLHHE